jgi:uncharacterized membrane protein YkgB
MSDTANSRGAIERLDRGLAGWMGAHATGMLRVSLAVVFIWFGALKVVGNSPAIELVTKTVYWCDPRWFVPVLGVWEVLIGVCMLWRPLIRVSIGLLALQMPGTFLPLVLLPGVCFKIVPWVPSLEGQYIIKNLVLIAAAMAVGGTVRRTMTPLNPRSDPGR